MRARWAALLIAALRQGGGLMEARVGVSSSLVLITQGLVVVLLAGWPLMLFWWRGRKRRVARDTAGPAVEST